MSIKIWVLPKDAKTIWMQIFYLRWVQDINRAVGQRGKRKQSEKSTLFSLFLWWVTGVDVLEKSWEMVQNIGLSDPTWSPRGLDLGLLGVEVNLSALLGHTQCEQAHSGRSPLREMTLRHRNVDNGSKGDRWGTWEGWREVCGQWNCPLQYIT